MARNNPELFNMKWQDKNRSYGEYFQTALALGVVVNDINRGYLFRNIAIGLSKEDAIRTLSMDQNILSSIGAEIFEKDKVIQIVESEVTVSEKKGKKGKGSDDKGTPEGGGAPTDFD
jgi:hypothetical protein